MILNFVTMCSVISVMLPLNSGQIDYRGESFPIKYFLAEDVIPENSDIEYYLHGLNKMFGYLEKDANGTDINRALGTFFSKTILKRTIKENKHKIQEKQLKLMKEVLSKADSVGSHYIYNLRNESWDYIERRLAELFKDEDLQIEGIGNYNRHRLQKWIVTNTTLNDFAKDMDELKLQRIDYLKQSHESVMSMNHSLALPASDFCLGSIIYNPKPQDTALPFTRCVAEQFCEVAVFENATSISYTLSHRMLNVMWPRHVRRCYFRSLKEDDQLLDVLCSSMYREAVYLARLGYFFRDIWMEHIALCGLLGYEEFFRRHWFRKVMSWIDNQGCIAENINTLIRRASIGQASSANPEDREQKRRKFLKKREQSCHWHQMSLGVVVLAHGVRHAVHFSETNTTKDEL